MARRLSGWGQARLRSPCGRPARSAWSPRIRADVAGTDPGRRDKHHRPFRKMEKENRFCRTDCGFRDPARSPGPAAAPRPPGRRQRSASDAVSRLCPAMSLRVWSASPRAMAAARSAWTRYRRLISCAAQVFAAGRTSQVLCPGSGTFGSGRAAPVAAAWRYDGPRGPGRSSPGRAPGAADCGSATWLPAGVPAASHAA